VLEVLKKGKGKSVMILTNWKTTVAGLLGAIAMALANYSGANTWQGYLACIFPVILGTLAKDFDTHSTAAQVQTATTAAAAAAAPAQPPTTLTK
jgi:hypothetical protein